MKKLLVASSNAGKVREFADLLAGLPCTITGLAQEGIAFVVDETGSTFEENARLKAEGYAAASGLLTLADDSGLVVDALDGRPGVHSARYGGPGLDDEGRVALLLREMQGIPDERRGARFVAVVALARPGEPARVAHGVVEGRIAAAPRGARGFGYDPIFLLPERGLTTAELTPDEKHVISHRGIATRAIRPVIEALLLE